MLQIVATPIGNRGDISPRAVAVITDADILLAEDTRRTGILLKSLGIPKKQFLSLHEHNEKKRTEQVVSLLEQGKNIVLVSDAGTPGISDPGYRLIRACREKDLPVSAVPGPCAAINALVLSGLPTDTFLFMGFLSRKRGQRKRELEKVRLSGATLIIYESPYRVEKLLADLAEVFGDKNTVIAREMTKKHEEIVMATPLVLKEKIKEKPIKGEFVVLVDTR